MDLIVETDIGRDPDDFFAICYLVAAGINIRAITISPGDQDQVAVAKFLCTQLGLNIPVGVADVNRQKSSVGGMHTAMLKKYGFTLRHPSDGQGWAVIRDTMESYPDSELFIIGPPQSVGAYLEGPWVVHRPFYQIWMQGGFVGYDVHQHPVKVRLPKFEGKRSVGTFNMNGDVVGTQRILALPGVARHFIGKNVCHTIEYDRARHAKVTAVPPQNRAMELLHEGMTMYLAKHDKKLFHDPAAAVCMLHPEIGTWINGTLFREGSGWGTEYVPPRTPGKTDQMLVDIDYDRLWQHVTEGS
jgi:pyrimidine-specific ribonucleoside hydrolase